MRLRPQDLVRIGQLYLDQGRWDGQQLVSFDWVEQATTMQVEARGIKYGYMWWNPDVADEHGYMAYGLGGQVIHVLPARPRTAGLVAGVGGGR